MITALPGRVLHALEAWALPAACLLCALPAAGDADLCSACEAGLQPAGAGQPPALAALAVVAHAAFDYDAASAPLLTRYKFHADLAAGRCLADLALPALAGAARPDALVAVPLHPQRLRERGHDQALGLARDWGRALRLPVLPGLLRRQRATLPQTALEASARRRNLAGAFVALGACPPHVALVDDVLTTGSTLAAAAEALFAAGTLRVQAWVVARASADRRHAAARPELSRWR